MRRPDDFLIRRRSRWEEVLAVALPVVSGLALIYFVTV